MISSRSPSLHPTFVRRRSLIKIALVGAAVLFFWWAASARAASLIYWGDENMNKISSANLDNSGGGSTLSTSGATAPSEPDGTTIDAATGKIYWVNENDSTVSYANLDGSGGGDLNTTGAVVTDPEGIAIDPATGKVYWANDSETDPISFANLDGSGGGNLDFTGATPDEPVGLAIDPATGKIYWGNYGNDTISFANLDDSGGGGQLNITGATPVGPAGVAIDQANGKLYWANYNGETISFANLNDSGGGGQLTTTGASLDNPYGLAIDPAAGKVYWANGTGASLSYANLDGSGGGGVNTSPVTPGFPAFPSLLEPPLVSGAPAISGTSALGSALSCSQGSWAPDLLESFLYRVPQSFAYSWTRNGTPIGGATSSSITASSPGSYVCQVTASNHAGSATQSSAAFTVSQPPPRVTTSRVGDQQITLTTPSPSVCTANTSKLVTKLDSTKIAHSKSAKLKFSSAAFYIDKGVKHKRHKTEHKRNGKTKKVVVITYTANATKRHVPVTVDLSLAGLKPGTHTLKVVLSYKQTKRKHGHTKTVTVNKTLKVKFTVC